METGKAGQRGSGETATGLASRQRINFAQRNKRRCKRTDLDGKRPGNGKGQRVRLEKTGTWNVCGVKDKEPEIVELMIQRNISVMGISDCRRKGNGIKETHEDYVITWSGVNEHQRANHGVGFILHPETAKNLSDPEYISERIIKIRIKEKDKTTNYYQVYAPCNDSYTDEEKDKFFELLADSLSAVPDDEDLVVMGDFNGRVGRRRDPWTTHMGPYSDTKTECNYNGHQLLSLCAEHDLVIANTLFQHRPSHIHTWYRWNDLTVSSQIDFILTRTSARNLIHDARAIPSAGLDTDHRPVIMWTASKRPRSQRKTTKPRDQINLAKLQKDIAVQEETKSLITRELDQIDPNRMSVQEAWCTFRDTLLRVLKTTCGIKKQGRKKRKATAWWNAEVKAAIKKKKRLFKEWARTGSGEDHDKYKIARRESKRVVKQAQDATWTTYGEELCELAMQAPREFYKRVKAMRLRDEPFSPAAVINDSHGDPIYDDEDIKKRWEDYFQKLLNPACQRKDHPQFTPSYPEHNEPTILEEEVRQAVKASPKNKAAGVDGIPVEALIACGETGITWLTSIFKMAWRERVVPSDWQKAVVVPIWKKKGSKKDCNTYRGISLLSHTGKIYAKILEQRTRAIVEPFLSEAQFGFRKGRGCTDAIFALRQLCERACEYNRQLHLVFVDQEKAFDRVNRDKLWEVLELYGVKGQLLDNIRAIYANSESAVRTSSGTTNWFKVNSGVRQGCVLSPLLFIIYMDKITKDANPDPEALNELLFADDQSMLSEDRDQLQHHTDCLDASCENHGMKISIGKTEVMTVGRTPKQLDITIKGEQLKQTKEFKYLGCFFTEDGKLDREIETRVQKANAVSYQLAPFLKHPSIPMTIKARLINTVFVPTLTYQCQTWTLNKALEQKITSCEMRCLRRAAGKTRRDRVRNEDIRKTVGVLPISHHIERQRIKWFAHLTRMPVSQPALRAYTMRFSGFRARGRPRRRWSDSVADTLRAHSMTVLQAHRLAADRQLHLPATPQSRSGRQK